jgi:hypothetical protein
MLDYGNATLLGLPVYLQCRMKLVSSARLIYDRSVGQTISITDALAVLRCMATSAGAHKFKTVLLTAMPYVKKRLDRYLSDGLAYVSLTFRPVAGCDLLPLPS